MLPSLLNIVIPIAFFAGALYALNRLKNDSELVVMWAAGFSRLQIAIPILLASLVAVAGTYACNMYLAPLGQRTMKDRVFDIRTDIGAAILREGTFTTPSEALTVFLREMDNNGEIRGLLVHDTSDPQRPITYIAQRGVLAQTEDGARLIMLDGDIEQPEDKGSRLSTLKFDQYVLNLDQYASAERTSLRDTSERYLTELLHPDVAAGPGAQRRINSYIAEAHSRLASPLYCIVFALIALAATCKGRETRAGYALRLLAAAFAGLGLRLIGYSLQGVAADHPVMNLALYGVPLMGAIAATISIADVPLWLRRSIPLYPAAEPAE
jgi:lipopolysaccharide export system permease protein